MPSPGTRPNPPPSSPPRSSGPGKGLDVTSLPSRSKPTRRRCQAMAEVSVRQAIWSITTRRACSSPTAVSQDGRSIGSSVPGAPCSTAAASSAISSRSRAWRSAAPARLITYSAATALSSAHSSSCWRGTIRSASYLVRRPRPAAARDACSAAVQKRPTSALVRFLAADNAANPPSNSKRQNSSSRKSMKTSSSSASVAFHSGWQ